MITAFLPCRRGSQRVPDKNVKCFSGVKGGLLEIKLGQLMRTELVDAIVVSSNDSRVLDFAYGIKDARIVIDERPDYLGSSDTTTDELIRYVPSLVSEGSVLWTHVTSPFMCESDYDAIIRKYREVLLEGYDSLATVLKIKGFVWRAGSPINYDRAELKWPMTQNVEPLFEIDSGVFLSGINNYCSLADRIGKKPYFYEQDKLKSVDIDWPEDFIFAEKLWALERT